MHEDTITGNSDEQSRPNDTFEALLEDAKTAKLLEKAGAGTPSPVQQRVIPLILAGKDVVVRLSSDQTDPFLYGAPIALKKSKAEPYKTIVISALSQRLGTITTTLEKLGLSCARIGDSNSASDGLMDKFDIFAGSPHDVLNALENDTIDLPQIDRMVFDGLDEKLSASTADTLDIIFTLVSNTHKNLQMILINKTIGGDLSSLVTRFFKTPQEVQGRIRSGSAPSEPCAHIYFEVAGSDLFSKPNLLCDIVESDGLATLIYCNSPSDADLVDVRLRKRGITSKKMVGFIPAPKMVEAFEQLKNHQISALVLTDVSAKTIDPTEAEMVINYSVHGDPEVYSQRCGPVGDHGNIRKVVSLVVPLDFGNFHYLKKLSGIDFVKSEPPSQDAVLLRKVNMLAEQAQRADFSADDKVKYLTGQVLAHEQRDAIVSLLVDNLLNPPMPQPSERAPEPTRDERYGGDRGGDDRRSGGRDDRRDDRGGRGGRDRGGRDQRGGGRYGDREGGGQSEDSGQRDSGQNGEGYRDNQEYGGSRDDDRGGDRREGRDNRRGDRGGDRRERNGERGDRGDRGDRRERRPQLPPEIDVRLYLGHGSSEGFTEQKLRDLIKEKCQISDESLRRFNLRDHYSFVDVPQESADAVLEGLSTSAINGKVVFAKKATLISTPRQAPIDEPAHSDQEDIGVHEPTEGRPFPEDAAENGDY